MSNKIDDDLIRRSARHEIWLPLTTHSKRIPAQNSAYARWQAKRDKVYIWYDEPIQTVLRPELDLEEPA